jgi:hypothetical protein
MKRGPFVLALAALLAGCSDGATRIAYDIESGAADFRRSAATSYSIKHVPEAYPEGCGGPYTVQFSARAILVIWCKDAAGAQTVASHGTTHHLRFVEVPRQINVDKPRGGPLYIDLEKRGGTLLLVDAR